VGDVVLKAPLLHAKELNVGGSLFGYRKLNAEDLGITLPETKLPAQPAPTAAPKGGHETTTPPAVAGKGKGRPGGGSGRSSGPPAELNLTDAQKAKWTAASDKMRTDMRGIFSSGVPREQMGAKMTELRAAFQDELKKFLTTEQLAKYEQTRSQRSPKGKGGGRPDGGGRPGGGSGRGGGMSLTRYDTDGDNKVSKAEFEKISERAREFLGEFSALDTNGDDFIDKTEEAAFIQKMMQRLGGGQ